ncbi:thrombospondin type 3 repeat-containing protein [Bacteriovorax sp. BAL6_X]|uniref:thrombospondin type 3 repeat-containing protein n=1 Tax=Bacteriovorax sp. BAL6_X TaxID=1201290 RepID=UPI0012ED725D|nr:thrombospondin type 3 repeat-containing protein [Bacteriovorax sp. BAL6_X]
MKNIFKNSLMDRSWSIESLAISMVISQVVLAAPFNLPPINEKLRYTINETFIEKDVIRNDNYFIFLDQDFDGIPDAMDNDIDGDGYDNITDEFPEDKTRFGSDLNNNGIVDFVDFEYSENITEKERAKASALQVQVYEDYNILIIPAVEINLKQVRLVKELLDIGFTDTTNHLKFVIFETTHPTSWLTKGKYDEEWKQIVIYKDQLINDEEINLTLTHEFFHFVQKENPELYQGFINSVGWSSNDNERQFTYQHNNDHHYPKISLSEAKLRLTNTNELIVYDNFPSKYATVSPEEMFAEAATAYLYQEKSTQRDFVNRFTNFEEFVKSQAFKIFNDLFSIF